MTIFFRYNLAIFILSNVIYKLKSFIPKVYGDVLFYPSMVFGVIQLLLFLNKVNIRKIAIREPLIFTTLVVTLIHVVFIKVLQFNDLLYLLSKASIFGMILHSRRFYFSFYIMLFSRMNYWFLLLLFSIGIFSYINNSMFDGIRLSLGLNPNDLGLLCSLCFFSSLVFEGKFNNLNLGTISILCLLLSQSRTALFLVVIGCVFYLIRSKRKIFLFGSFILIGLIFNYTKDSFIFERLINEDLESTRQVSTNAGVLTFLENPIWGSGVSKYAWLNPRFKTSDEFSAPHSFYLSNLIMYGFLFGSIVIVIYVYVHLAKIWTLLTSKLSYLNWYFILMSVLIFISGFVESVIVGVNDLFVTLFFVFSSFANKDE